MRQGRLRRRSRHGLPSRSRPPSAFSPTRSSERSTKRWRGRRRRSSAWSRRTTCEKALPPSARSARLRSPAPDGVASDADGQVRLAELVAALSLGVDLGFGQPMEHVLRQCLIALRPAERGGLDEQRRADVYYTALLVNGGCHSHAHEQAKWFGDEHAPKSGK